jgi:hypothetical protein
MSLSDGKLTYAVTDFESSSFGDYPNDDGLRFVLDSQLQNLNGYSYESSLSQSGATFAQNRVSHLVLKRVRLYGANGLIEQINLNDDIAE